MKREFFTQYTKIPPVKPEVNEEPSLAWQHCKEECDIMHIVKQPNLGINPFDVPTRKPMQGDFSGALDYQEAQNLIIRAKEQFDSLPSNVRDRFNNDPVKMLSFIENPENIEACIELGIFEKKETKLDMTSAELHEITKGPIKSLEPEKAGPEPVSGGSETVRTSNT